MQDGYSAMIKEVLASVSGLARSEVRLALAEAKHNTRLVGRHATMTAIGGVLAVLSVLAFMSFLVIGLGRLLNDNYWLSSLIVGVVFLGVGAFMARAAIARIKSDINFEQTQRNLETDRALVSSRMQRVAETRTELVPGVLSTTGAGPVAPVTDFQTEKERRLSA